MKKISINKASDLPSLSVFPPNFGRRSAEPQASQPLRSQQLQQSFSQGPSSSSHRCYGFSQMTQTSLEEQRISSQERDLSFNKARGLPPISHKREDSHWAVSRSTGRSSSASLGESKLSQMSEELEQRFGMMETSLSRLGMMLDSIQKDIMQANRGTKEVFLETERIQQKLILHDASLQQLQKEQADAKASLGAGIKSILEELSEDPNQEKLQNITLMLTAILEQFETSLQKIHREICHTFTREIQVLASLNMSEPRVQIPTAPQQQAKENPPEVCAPEAKISNEGIEVLQPLMYFSPTNYTKSINMSGKCYIHEAVDKLKRHLQEDEILWFREHPQFKHFFHMFREHPQFKHFFHMQTQPYHLWMPIWMLLLRTARLEKKKECWFIVNGVPIRYSLREFALISGLYCHQLPNNYREDLQDLRFVEKHFGKRTSVTYGDVEKKLMSMKEPSGDRLQMAVLYFLSNVLIAKPEVSKYASYIEEFFLSAVNDLELCKTFPWGRMAFEENMSDIFHMMDHYKGSVESRSRWIFPSFITPLEFLAYETIPILMRNHREKVRDAKPECPRMCKTHIKSSIKKWIPLSEVYDTLGETKDIQSIMVPDAHEESLLREIMDQEEDTGDDADVVSGTWTRCLIEERKPIWFEQLYNEDIGTRGNKGNVGETSTYATDACLLERVGMLEKEMKEKDEKLAAMDKRLKSIDMLEKEMKEKDEKFAAIYARLKSMEQKVWDQEVESGEKTASGRHKEPDQGAEAVNEMERADEDNNTQNRNAEEQGEPADEDNNTRKRRRLF